MDATGGEVHIRGGSTGYSLQGGSAGFSIRASRRVALGLDGGLYAPFAPALPILLGGGRASLRANPIGDHVAFVFGAGAGGLFGLPYGTLDAGIHVGTADEDSFANVGAALTFAESFSLVGSTTLETAFYGVGEVGLWLGPPRDVTLGICASLALGRSRSFDLIVSPSASLTLRFGVAARPRVDPHEAPLTEIPERWR